MSPTHESIFCQKNLSFSLKNMLFRQKMDSYEWGSRGGGIIKNGLWSDVIYGRSPGVLEFFRANWL